VLFTTLYTSGIALVELVYQFINRTFPDSADGTVLAQSTLGSVRWSTACLLIAFPVFLYLGRRSYRATRRDPEQRTSKIRKWLTYLTLFVAASALLCDVITLVFYLLGGELTVRFLLKVLTVAAVAGSVFGYFLWDLRQADRTPEELSTSHRGLRVFASVVVTIVTACAVGGILIAGSPELARSQRLDTLRVQHLMSIAGTVDTYWKREGELPGDLESLAAERTGAPAAIRDPATREIYEYLPDEAGAYQLCAVFEEENLEPEVYGRRGARFWGHGAGRHCFGIEVR